MTLCEGSFQKLVQIWQFPSTFSNRCHDDTFPRTFSKWSNEDDTFRRIFSKDGSKITLSKAPFQKDITRMILIERNFSKSGWKTTLSEVTFQTHVTKMILFEGSFQNDVTTMIFWKSLFQEVIQRWHISKDLILPYLTLWCSENNTFWRIFSKGGSKMTLPKGPFQKYGLKALNKNFMVQKRLIFIKDGSIKAFLIQNRPTDRRTYVNAYKIL